MGLFNGLKKLAGAEKSKKPVKKKSSKRKTIKKEVVKKKPKEKVGKKKTTKKAPLKKATKKMAKKKETLKKKTAKTKKQKKRITPKKTKKKTIKKRVVKKKTVKKKLVKKKVKNVKKKLAAKKKTKKKTKKPKKVILTPKRLSHSHAVKLVEREDAKSFIIKIAGEEGLQVFSYLIRIGKQIDEFTLADKVGLQINFVRSLLYKLYEYKLVSFSRERDKKKGWFIYSWVAHPDRLKELLIRKKDEQVIKLRKKALDVHQVFYCEHCDKSFSYTKAMKYMFFCPTCGRGLVALESSELRDKLNEKIKKILLEKKEIEDL